jgi:hypothetical protein
MENQQPSIKFDISFIQKAEEYLNNSKHPTVEEFSKSIGTNEESVLAWANKKAKDKDGNVTDQLARPSFFNVIEKIKNYKEEKKEEVKPIKEELELNVNQEKFCFLYASDMDFFGSGVDAYCEAYNLNRNDPKDYNTARTNASRLLTNANILTRINELLENDKLNDAFVDKQLAFVVTQNADLSSKVAAIKEYNKLKSRITEKLDHTTNGKDMPIPIYGGKSTE